MKTRRWMARVGVVLGIAVLSWAPAAFGQNCPEHLDEIWVSSDWRFGDPFLMEGDGSLVISVGWWSGMPKAPDGNTMSIIDVSDPEGPRIVGQVGDRPNRAGNDIRVTDLDVSDGRAFFINGAHAVDFIDLSDPWNPYRIPDYYRSEGDSQEFEMSQIEVSGHFVFIATSSGLTILDVSDIDNPTEVGFYETSWEPTDLAVEAGYAYVTESGVGLRIVDVSDSAEPIEVGLWSATWESHDLDVSGGVAYVAAGGDGLRIIDVADRANPAEVAVYDKQGGVESISVDDQLAAAVVSEGVSIINVSSPENPKETDLYTAEFSAWEALLTDQTMYVAVREVEGEVVDWWDSLNGFRVVDVSSPGSANERASIDFRGPTVDVAVSENAVYTAHGDMGISLDGPERRDWLDTPGSALGVTLYGQYVMVADGHKGLRIIDTAEPSGLEEVGFLDTPGQAQRIVVADDHAYVADGDGGLRIIDISSPTSPEEVGFVATPGHAMDLAISGDWAYVSDGPGSLHVIDVSDPSQPIERNDTWWGGFLAVAGQLLVAAAGDGLELHDISDPASPDHIYERGILPGEATDLVVEGPHAFVSTRSDDHGRGGGVTVFDISLPSNPIRKVGTWERSEGVVRLDVAGGQVYVATGEGHLSVLDTRCLTTYWVELVAHQPGFGGSKWRSDVIIMQQPEGWLAQDRFDVSVEFVLHTRDGLFTAEATVPPRSTAVFEDIVGLLGYEGQGALEIRAETPIWVSGRAYNLTESGTSGAYLPGYRSSECLGEDQTAHLLGLRQEEGKYRTNISVTNVGDEAQSGWIGFFTADGRELGHIHLRVEPRMTVQEIQPFKNRFNHPNVGWGSALVHTYPGGIFASATVIDSRTNDAVVVPMTPVPEWIYMVK